MNNSELPPSVQFYDSLHEITALRERRFSATRIWEKLKNENKYCGDYSHFLRLIKKEFGSVKVTSGSPRPTQQRPRQQGPRKPQRVTPDKPDKPDNEADDGPLVFMEDLSSKK